MARKVLVGNNLKEAQEQFKEGREDTIGVISSGTRVEGKPESMTARREMSFRELLRQSSKRELTPSMEGIKEQREEGIFEGKSYVDNVTNREIIEFIGPEGQIELASGYNNGEGMTLEELADITAFKYGEKTEEQRSVFMDVNGVKVPVKEGEVSKQQLMNQYAQMQGFKDYETMKKEQVAFRTNDGQGLDSPYADMEVGDWD